LVEPRICWQMKVPASKPMQGLHLHSLDGPYLNRRPTEPQGADQPPHSGFSLPVPERLRITNSGQAAAAHGSRGEGGRKGSWPLDASYRLSRRVRGAGLWMRRSMPSLRISRPSWSRSQRCRDGSAYAQRARRFVNNSPACGLGPVELRLTNATQPRRCSFRF
jgi:hypothetical protein